VRWQRLNLQICTNPPPPRKKQQKSVNLTLPAGNPLLIYLCNISVQSSRVKKSTSSWIS
jgi:hypothetical protein